MPYDLVGLSSSSHQLFKVAMTGEPSHDDPGRPHTELQATVPSAGLSKLEIVSTTGKVLNTQTKNPKSPVVQMTSPTTNQKVGTSGTVTVKWKATSSNPDLRTEVDYSKNAGLTWTPVYLGPNKGSATLPAGDFAASSQARLRVRANDGFNETTAMSAGFTSVGAPPTVTILSLSAGTRSPPIQRSTFGGRRSTTPTTKFQERSSSGPPA